MVIAFVTQTCNELEHISTVTPLTGTETKTKDLKEAIEENITGLNQGLHI